MKYYIGFLILFLALLPLPAAEFSAQLNPDTVVEGETFELVLDATGKDAPELMEMPKGFARQGVVSHSTTIRNGVRKESVAYLFAAKKAGEYTIEPLTVKVGNEMEKTPPLKLKVLKDDAELSGSDEVAFQGSFGSERTQFYAGEEIPLTLTLLSPDSKKITIKAFPEVKAPRAIFRDYSSENPSAPMFAMPRDSHRTIGGKHFNVLTFSTVFRPLATGKLQVQSSINVDERVPVKGRSRDPFFDDFFGNNHKIIPHTLEAKLPELTILPLPPAPTEGIYLGLVGDYRGTLELSAYHVEAQEPLTLTLTLRGKSSFESLQVPKLQLDGFRVYPGENDVKAGVATIRYAMIPLQSGQLPVKVKLFYFAPETGEYKTVSMDTAVKAPTAPRTTLLYLKDAPGKAVQKPWYRNQLGWVIFLFLAGPACFALGVWRQKSRAMRAQDGGFQRRERAFGRKKELLNQVRNATDEVLSKVVTGSVTAYLSDRWGLPPGATPEEIARKANDAELAEVLRQCAQVSYLPNGLAKQAIPDMEKVRRVILKAVKLLLLAILPLAFADAAEPATWSEALACYDRSEFAEARKFFENRLKTVGEEPNALYNLGCIAEAENEPAKALWLFEKARLLAPYDSAMQENCNVLRRKFFLPEIGTKTTPQEMIASWRNHWRPDHYLLVAAAAWALLWVLASFRKSLPRQLTWSMGVIVSAVLLLAVVAGISELRTNYRPDRGIVTAKSTELLSFPGAQNGRKVGALSGGSEVRILERRQEYLHVSGGDLEGWVKSHDVGELP